MRTTAFRPILAVAAAALLAVSGIAVASPATAATMTVTTEAELVAAITTANTAPGPHTILLGGAGFALTGDLPDITRGMVIQGPGAYTLDGNGDYVSGFRLEAGDHSAFTAYMATSGFGLTLSSFSITSGASADLISASRVTITIDQVDVTGTPGAGGWGLYFDRASAIITASSFTDIDNNLISAANGNVVQISDSTFTGNGDGISADVSGTAGAPATIIIDGVTASGNRGVGIDLRLGDGSNAVITDTVVSDNAAGIDIADHSSAASPAVVRASGVTTNSNAGSGVRLELHGTSQGTLESITSANNDGEQISLFVGDAATLTATSLTAQDGASTGIGVTTVGTSRLTISDSSSTANTDGVVATASDTSALTFDGLTVTGNAVGLSADADAGASVSLARGTISANTDGGVAVTSGAGSTIAITDSTISANSTPASNRAAGVHAVVDGTLTIDRSTISGNSGPTAIGGLSASITASGDLRITNSTLSGNSSNFTAALFTEGPGAVGITNSTITANTGGIAAVLIVESRATISHSIIADNTATTGTPADLDLGDFGGPAATLSVDYSLVKNAGSQLAAPLAAGTGNILKTSAKLNALADNGGPTLTHLPQADSAAINAGNPALTGAPATDQRGSDRVIDVIDIGSVETAKVLPRTGVEINPILPIGGGILLLAGIAFAVVAALRRRRSERP